MTNPQSKIPNPQASRFRSSPPTLHAEDPKRIVEPKDFLPAIAIEVGDTKLPFGTTRVPSGPGVNN
jgi:hypothetical protein